MNRFAVTDVILRNNIARFLHSICGEEGRLWRTAEYENDTGDDRLPKHVTIFAVDEANAFKFTMQVFEGRSDPRIIVIPNQEAQDGTSVRSPVGGEPSADGAESRVAQAG